MGQGFFPFKACLEDLPAYYSSNDSFSHKYYIIYYKNQYNAYYILITAIILILKIGITVSGS